MMIERIDRLTSENLGAVQQIQAIISGQFPTARVKDIQELPERLAARTQSDPQTVAFAAKDSDGSVQGFAILLFFARPRFLWLEYISVAPGHNGRGIGGMLYRRVRDEALKLDLPGLFFECCVDDPALVPHPTTLADNLARMKFYERLGARPILNNDYARPLSADDYDLYYLMYDHIDPRKALPAKSHTRKAVATIMRLRYSDTYNEEAIAELCASFRDDPLQLRPPIYFLQSESDNSTPARAPLTGTLATFTRPQ